MKQGKGKKKTSKKKEKGEKIMRCGEGVESLTSDELKDKTLVFFVKYIHLFFFL